MPRFTEFSRLTLIVLVIVGLMSSGCAYMPWASSDKDEDLSFDENALFADDPKSKGGAKKKGEDTDFFSDEKEKGTEKGDEGKEDKEGGFASLDQGSDTGEMKTGVSGLTRQQQELASKIRQMEETLAQLQPRLEAAQGKMMGGLGAAAEKGEALEPEIRELKQQIVRLNDEIEQLKTGRPAKAAPAPKGKKGGKTAAASGPIPAEYTRAHDLYRQGKFDQSLLAFQKFASTGPPESLQDNVIYWMGANHFKLEMFDEAIREFETVITKYSHGNKVQDAMYLLALCHEKKGDKAKAADILEAALKRKPSRELRDKIEQKLSELR